MDGISISIDWSAIGTAVVTALFSGVQQLMSPLPSDFTKWVIQQLQMIMGQEGSMNLLTHIPVEWTSENAEVLSLWRGAMFAEAALLTLVGVVQGWRVMHQQIDLFDAFARLGVLAIVGGMMPIWADLLIHMFNALSSAVGSVPLDIRNESMPNDLAMAVMLIIGLFFAVLAWLKGAIGVLFIDVLIVSAPIIFPLAAIPKMTGLTDWWIKEFTVWIMRPFMVALVLRLGLGLGVVNSGGLQLLFAIVAFWLAWSMDTRIRSFSVGAWGSVAQMNLFGRGLAAAAGALSGGASTVAQGAAAAGSAAVGTAGSAAQAYSQRLHS